jgi:exonuclease VII small subunit
VKEAVLPFVEAMRDFLPRAIAIAAETFQNLWPTIQQVAGFLIEAWGQLAQVTAQAWGRIIAVLEQNRGKLKNIFDALNTIIRALLPVVKFVFQTFLIPLLKLVFVQILPRAINVAIGALDVLASAIKITARVVQGFASGVSAAWNKARAIFEGVKSAVTGAFSGASSWLTNAGKEVVQGFVNGARAVFGAVRSALATIRSSVTRAVSGAAKWLYSAGREIITGFISGIRSMAGSIISAIRETITDKLPGYVKKALGISSPSKVFEEIGRQLGLGLAKGIRDHKAEVLKAAREVVRALIQAAPSAAEQVASAFAPIGDTLSRAFSQKQAAQKTPAEVQLQQIQDARAEAQRQEALQAAQHNLLIAKTDEERTAAEKEVADALYEIRVAALEKQAETERQALEDQQFVEQQSFDARLAALQTFLANVKNTTAQKQAEIGTFLSDFGLGGMSAILQQSIAAAMPALTAALDAMATEYEKAVARVKKAQKELRAAQQNVVKITGQVTKRVRRRRRSQGATGESGGGAAVATAGLLGAGDTGSGLTGPVPIGQDLARTLNRVLPSIAEAPEPEFEVRVFIGDQELRGLVRTEVRRSDDATARLILAQSAGVA